MKTDEPELVAAWRRPHEPHDPVCQKCGAAFEPKSLAFEAKTPIFEGTVVLLTYQDMGGVQKLVLNGTVFGWDEIGHAKAHARKLFGPDHVDDVMLPALRSVANHQHRRIQ